MRIIFRLKKISHIFLTLLLLSVGCFPKSSHSEFSGLSQQSSKRISTAEGSLVGNFSGKFSVNLLGSAVYDMSLPTPPGTAGMTPNLAIHYDSSTGNGLLGMGFTLQGLTAITRVSQNYAQNGKIHGVNFTTEDRFALNGQQLVALPGTTYGADGTEYRTYIDSQARILSKGIQGNGPAGFVVQTKSGQTAWYGTTPDSQILAQGKNSVAIWALAKIQDAAGNYILYHYTQDETNGSYYPSEIDYTGNDQALLSNGKYLQPYNKIKLSYEERPDRLTTYTSGSLFRITKRLSAISTFQGTSENPGANLVMTYHLNYQLSPNTFRSRITAIQQCDATGSCLRPAQFNWQTNEAGWVEAPTFAPTIPLVLHATDQGQDNSYDAGVRFVDLHGTGHPTMLFGRTRWAAPQPIDPDQPGPHEPGADPTRWGAWRTTDQGWVVEDSTWLPPIQLAGESNNWNPTMNLPRGIELLDLEGNGKLHLIQSLLLNREEDFLDGHHVGQWVRSHYIAEKTGWEKHVEKNFTPDIAFPMQAMNFFMSTSTSCYGVTYPSQSPVQWADLRGTGRLSAIYGGLLDWISHDAHTQEYNPESPNGWQELPNYHTPRAFVNGIYERSWGTGLELADLNGDGLPDLMVANPNDHHVWINTGNGWIESSTYHIPSAFNIASDFNNTMRDDGGRLIDLLGSGLPDLIHAIDGNRRNWINTGEDWIPGPATLDPPTDIIHRTGSEYADNGVIQVDVTNSDLPGWLQCSDSINKGECHAWLNENGRWVAHDEWKPPLALTDAKGHDTGVRFIDLLGTGFPDIIASASDRPAKAWLNKAQKKPDMLTDIEDSLGDHLQIQYKPITDDSVYTKGTEALYPNKSLQIPLWVVSQTRSDTAITPQNLPSTQVKANAAKLKALAKFDQLQHITNYHYANAELNHLGWGFLGFGEMTASDENTGISTRTRISLDTENHTQGFPIGTETKTKEGVLINQQNTKLAVQLFGTGKLNESYFFPYAQNTQENTFDLDGKALSTTTTTNTFDDYANLIDKIESAQDNTGTYTIETKNITVNTINPALNLWRLGEVQHSEVITDATPLKHGMATHITRHSDFTYDANGFLKTLVDSAGLTKIFSRDHFGNIIKTEFSAKENPHLDPITPRYESITYDTYGRFITTQTNALGHTSTQEIDPKFGVVINTTDPNHLTTQNILDSLGRVIQTTHPDKTTTSTTLAWVGEGTDPAAPPTAVYKSTQMQSGTPTKITYYDELNREIAQTMQAFIGDGNTQLNPNSGKWIWQLTYYDELGRIIGKSLPFFAGDAIYHNTNRYDLLGRVILSTNADGSQTKQTYEGYKTSTINPKGQVTIRIYNVRNNLVESIDAENHHTYYDYDAFNNLTKLTDSQGHTTTIQYDDLGHKIVMDDMDRGHSTYHYDTLGELTSQTDANHQTTQFHYDLLGRLVARTDGDITFGNTTSSWEYDSATHGIGKLAKESGISNPSSSLQLLNAAMQHIVNYSKTYNYDDFERLKSTTTTIQNQNYTTLQTYDDQGRPLTSIAANNFSTTNHYDPLGYLISITDTNTGEIYQHINQRDAAGHITSETHANGLITLTTYDPKTQFITDIQTLESKSLQLEQQFLPSYLKLQEGTWKIHTSSNKSPAQSPSTQQNPKKEELQAALIPIHKLPTYQSLHYTYDPLGNPIQKIDNILELKDNYQYDNLNRLTQNLTLDKIHSNPTVLNYAYDELGNILDKSDIGYYHYGNEHLHAVSSITGKEADYFTYDANGNQIQAIMEAPEGMITRNISYTSFDVPKQITQSNAKTGSSASVAFFYNADRQRIMREDQSNITDPLTHKTSTQKTTTLYLGEMEIDTTLDNTSTLHTVTKNYIGDAEKITDENNQSKMYSLLKDNIGSTTVITDETGNIIQRFHYDPFGEQNLVLDHTPSPTSTLEQSRKNNTAITRYGFTGQEEVETAGIDLIHMNGRMYDPHLGRFLSADPIIQEPSNTQSLNRYSYCLNDPLALTDPSGFSWWNHLTHAIGHLFHDMGHELMNTLRRPVIATLLQIAVAVWAVSYAGPLFQPQMFWHFATSGATNGIINYAQSGNVGHALQTAALTLASEYAWAETGDLLKGADLGTRMSAHALVGGATDIIQGAHFKDGFLAASISEALSGQIATIDIIGNQTATIAARGFTAGLLGGTVAAAGGNFENGMMTSAFAEMFNDSLHSFKDTYPDQEKLQTALGTNGVTYGVRPLNSSGLNKFTFDADGLLSLFNKGLYHEEIFWTDEIGRLHTKGYFAADDAGPQGIRNDSEFGKITTYRFQPIQHYAGGMSLYSSAATKIFPAEAYSLPTNNCQTFAETFRDVLGSRHY